MSYAECKLLLCVAAGLLLVWAVLHFAPASCIPEDSPLVMIRQVAIRGFSMSSYRELKDWNRTITVMYNQCHEVGASLCLMVPYEQLVLHPHDWMEKILSFVDVPWNDSVLHHEELVNKPGGVLLSRVEKSTDQVVVKPINLDALTSWMGYIPPDVVEDMAQLAPMLSFLGYNPHANPPNYGSPDLTVIQNTKLIHFQEEMLKNKAKDLISPIKVLQYGRL